MRGVLLLALMVFTAQAQSINDAAKEHFKKTDTNFFLNCYNGSLKDGSSVLSSSKTKLIKGEARRSFRFFKQGISRTFTLSVIYQGSSLKLDVESREKTFTQTIKKISVFTLDFVPELKSVQCSLHAGVDDPVTLSESFYHINVHPHTRYDNRGVITKRVEETYALFPESSFLILEDKQKRSSKFSALGRLRSGSPSTPPRRGYYYWIPLNLDMTPNFVTSPVGHNKFEFKNDGSTTILYTGGNHNFCMWNNTQHLLEAYLRSPFSGNLNIFYDAKKIVAQVAGIIYDLNIDSSHYFENHRLDVLMAKHKAPEDYHRAYLDSQLEHIKEFKSLFAKVNVSYESAYLKVNEQVEGTGERVLSIKLQYIGE